MSTETVKLRQELPRSRSRAVQVPNRPRHCRLPRDPHRAPVRSPLARTCRPSSTPKKPTWLSQSRACPLLPFPVVSRARLWSLDDRRQVAHTPMEVEVLKHHHRACRYVSATKRAPTVERGYFPRSNFTRGGLRAGSIRAQCRLTN